MKPIRLTRHATQRCAARGATEAEVRAVVLQGARQPAKRGKTQAVQRFSFDQPSPVNQRVYRFKTVEAVFVEETAETVVITVKVYYHDA